MMASSSIVDECRPVNNNETKAKRKYESTSSIPMSSVRSTDANETSSVDLTDSTRRSSDSSTSGHCHSLADHVKDDFATNRAARRTLILASIVCVLFMVAEAVGGYLADSLAIMTDAAHLLTDFASFMISLFSLYMATRPPTQRLSFGWHRAEVLGALASVVMIWVITGILVYLAVVRIINKDYEINATIMVATAGSGVGVNIIMGLMLSGLGHGHSHFGSSHGHSHGKEEHGHSHDTGKHSKGKAPQQNINVRAAFIHVIGDLLQSLGVLVAATIIYFYPHLQVIDPICTFVFSVLVVLTTVAIMRDTLTVLMEGKPRGMSFPDVIEALKSIDGVVLVHDLRIWSLTMDKVALSAHLATDGKVDSITVLTEARSKLRHEFGVYECTLQVEIFTSDMQECNKCEPPTK